MKLTKTSWIFLIAGVLIIAVVGLGMARSQQSDLQQQLSQQLSLTKVRLASFNNESLAAQKEQLTAQISSYTSQFNSAKTKLSSQDDSISASDTVLKTAVDSGVDVINMTSSGQSAQKLAQTDFTTISLNIQVEGDFNTIDNFVVALSEKFPTSLASTVQENANPPPPPSPVSTAWLSATLPAVPGSTPAASPSPTPVQKTFRPVSATISLVIYNYGGK
jgi:Tfp pilus assembly protein PilO